jgi:hypothetical protein
MRRSLAAASRINRRCCLAVTALRLLCRPSKRCHWLLLVVAVLLLLLELLLRPLLCDVMTLCKQLELVNI